MAFPRIAALAAALLAAAPLAASEPAETSVSVNILELPGETRALVHETVVDAPIEKVWEAFTTVEGWKSWGVQFAEMDVRAGGLIETGYFADAAAGDPRNIKHRILAMTPQRQMVTRIEQAPEGGPVDPAIFAQMWTVYDLEPLADGRTRLTISGYGYEAGEGFDRVLAFFEHGNTASIEAMRRVMEAGN